MDHDHLHGRGRDCGIARPNYWASNSQIETIPYSQFEQLLNEDKIAEVTISAGSIRGKLKAPSRHGRLDGKPAR
jgi:cell division protease FtsH